MSMLEASGTFFIVIFKKSNHPIHINTVNSLLRKYIEMNVGSADESKRKGFIKQHNTGDLEA